MKYTLAALVAAVAAECGDPLLTSVTMYEDDKCEKEVAGQDDASKKKDVEDMNKGVKDMLKCNELVKDKSYSQLTCSDTGAELKMFSDKDCKTASDEKAAVAIEIKWGECTTMAKGVYVKATGAHALAAPAAAGAAILATLY